MINCVRFFFVFRIFQLVVALKAIRVLPLNGVDYNLDIVVILDNKMGQEPIGWDHMLYACRSVRAVIDIFLSNFSSKADKVCFSPGVGPNLEIVVENFCYQAHFDFLHNSGQSQEPSWQSRCLIWTT